MSVIQFRPKTSSSDEQTEELGNPLIRKQSAALPDLSDETRKLARKQIHKRRAFLIAPALLLFGALCYAIIAMMSHQIDDDLDFPGNIRQTWSSPWAGVSASILERERIDNGWTPSALEWTPAARLTAMPAWQSGLAEAIGMYSGLAAKQASVSDGELDEDLATAARLLSGSVNKSELRAAYEALVSYDGRVRRHRVSGDVTASHFVDRLMLMASWANDTNRELMEVFHTAEGWPLDDYAVIAIYRARARAYVAHRLISAIDTHYADNLQDYREVALRSWGRAAQFSPLIVVNGAPDSSFFTSHTASMRNLMIEAEAATVAYAEALAPMAQPLANDAKPASLIETHFVQR